MLLILDCCDSLADEDAKTQVVDIVAEIDIEDHMLRTCCKPERELNNKLVTT